MDCVVRKKPETRTIVNISLSDVLFGLFHIDGGELKSAKGRNESKHRRTLFNEHQLPMAALTNL